MGFCIDMQDNYLSTRLRVRTLMFHSQILIMNGVSANE